jgi:hypothetical protein
MIQRFQLYFPVPLFLRLREASLRRGLSIAAYVREAVEAALRREGAGSKPDPLDAIVGKGRSRERDLSYHHDKYLYGWVKDARRRKR